VSGSFKNASPLSVLWTAPSILAASMLIAWAAESAQFFIAQGVALAILAWLQTLPEFAVEAVLAWKQQVPLLMANLTGALRLLTGLGWPMIYAVAAYYYKRNTGKRMGEIRLAEEHSVEVVGLFAALAWGFVVWIKGTLGLVDAAILIAVYCVYLWVLRHMPSADKEDIDDLERIPRAIVTAPPKWRILAIAALFAAGGGLIYATAEPFLASLLAVSTAVGIPNFVFVQWVAPFVSEFPEKVSAFYWARTVERASMALMNMVSSNINQWTLLAAMLPIVYSMSRGTPSTIPLDSQQELELLLTLGQSLLSAVFLLNMRLAWWEAAGLFGLWIVQFAFTTAVHDVVTAIYFVWAAVEIGRVLTGRSSAPALRLFGEMWRRHVR
jgi:cation:H+ antiporter